MLCQLYGNCYRRNFFYIKLTTIILSREGPEGQNESVTEYGLRLNKTEILNSGIQYLHIYISFNAMSTIRELLPQKLSAENNDTIHLIVSTYRFFLAAIDQVHCRSLYQW